MNTQMIDTINLETIGITGCTDQHRNLSYDVLFDHETATGLGENESGTITSLGAITIDTGKFTGRSAKDKYIVKDSNTEDTIWWSDQGSSNKAIPQSTWNELKQICQESAFQQKTLHHGRFLWCQPRHAYVSPTRYRSRMASPLLQKHVHPPNRSGTKKLQTRLDHPKCLQNDLQKFQRIGSQIRSLHCL